MTDLERAVPDLERGQLRAWLAFGSTGPPDPAKLARAADILWRRFCAPCCAVTGKPGETRARIAADYGLTPTRIAQLESQALRRLAHPARGAIVPPLATLPPLLAIVLGERLALEAVITDILRGRDE